jgi:hypothetical protein
METKYAAFESMFSPWPRSRGHFKLWLRNSPWDNFLSTWIPQLNWSPEARWNLE